MIMPPPTTRTCGVKRPPRPRLPRSTPRLSRDGCFRDHQRRADLHRAAAETDRREHQHALLDALVHDARSESAIRFLRARLDACHTRHETFAVYAADLRVLLLNDLFSSACRIAPIRAAFPARSSFRIMSIEASAAAQQIGIARVGGGHAARQDADPSHPARPITAASGSELEMPLPQRSQVRHDAVMLESPQRARTAESGLHLIADQQRLVGVAPARSAFMYSGGAKAALPPW